jgi:hypothetical protein
MQIVKHYTSFEALKSDSCTSKEENDQAPLYESSLHDFVTLLKENVVIPEKQKEMVRMYPGLKRESQQ